MSLCVLSYFELFIDGFTKDQLNISAMQGRVELKDVALVNSTVQEMLLIPTSMLVTKATCSELVMQLPKLTEIRRRPIVLSIDEVNVSLEEPEEVPPMPTKLREFFAAKKKVDPSKKKKQNDDVGRGMNYSVKKLSLSLKLRNNPHVLTVDVSDFKLSSCTASGEISDDLAACKVVSKEGEETVFKTGSIGSVTVAVGTGSDRIVILNGLPAQLRMHNSVSFDLGLPLQTMFDVVIGKFELELNRGEFYRHYQFAKDINACMDRYSPARKEAREQVEVKGERVDFDLQMEHWTIGVRDERTSEKVSVSGENLRIGGSPPRAVTLPETQAVEQLSSAAIGMGSLCVEFVPDLKSPEKKHVLVQSHADSGSSFDFLVETKRIDADTTPSVGFKFWLNQLCVFLHKDHLSKIYRILNLAADHEELKMDLASLPQKAERAKEKLKGKMEWTFDEWYQATDALVEISDLQVIVPPDAALTDEEMRAMSIKAVAKKVIIKTSPGWTAVPHMADGKVLLNAQHSRGDKVPPPVNRPVTGGSRWQAGVEGFDLSIYKGDEILVHVAEPSDVMLYGRLVTAKEKTPLHVEVSIRTSNEKLIVSDQVVAFFNSSWASYSGWARELLQLGDSKEESKESIKDKLAQLKDGMGEVEDSRLKSIVEKAADHDYAGVISESLAAFTGLLYIRFEGGSAFYHDNFAEFESFQLAAEFGSTGQEFVTQLGAVTCKNLHHDSMAVVLDLEPVRRAKGGALSQAESAVTLALKRPGRDMGVPTIVELGLSNVAVTSKGQRALSPLEVVGELTKYAESRAEAGMSKETKEVVSEVQSAIKLHGKKVLDSLNLHWRFRLGECSFTHRDFDQPDESLPRGVATVGAVDWAALEKRFGDIENQLIEAKMQLVTNEQEKEELRGNLRAMQETVLESMKQVEEKGADFMLVNQKLMEERMKMSEMQEEIDRFKRGGPPPVNRSGPPPVNRGKK